MTDASKYLCVPEVSTMRGLSCIVTLIGALALSACSEADHPDTSQYEYLYSNGAFVSPYKAFPTARDRGDWQCYDAKEGRAFDCMYVRGGFEHFQYIYRKRPN